MWLSLAFEAISYQLSAVSIQTIIITDFSAES